MIVALTFTAIIALIVGGLSWSNHRSMAQLAHREAHQRFSELARQIRDETRDQLATAQIFLTTISETAALTGPDMQTGELLLNLLRTLQTSSPAVLGVLTGWPDGSLVLSQRVVRPTEGMPDKASYSIIISRPASKNGEFTRQTTYLSANGDVLGHAAPVASDYDVRNREWYDLAMESRSPVTPAPYQFASVPEIGVTVAQQSARTPGLVFGLDVLLSDLDDVLDRLKTHPRQELALFTEDGELAAHPLGRTHRASSAASGPHGLPLMASLDSPLLQKIAAVYRDEKFIGDRIIRSGNEDYLVRFEPGLTSTRMVTAIAIPQAAILGAANDMARRLLAMGFLALFIALPIVAFAARSITRPLHALTGAVGKIVTFQSTPTQPPPSRILEIHALSRSVAGLERAMNNFMRYVPRQIVRNIVKDGVQPTLGGVRQPTTVLFSDIVNFTGIAERLPPEDLTSMISRYFGVAGGALVDSGGTIDKFIGDSVMAFWNAPEPQPDHVTRACEGVLDAARRLEDLNAEFRNEGLPELKTRFGIHTGEAVIGHVGSLDRLSYTVLGHTVNIASRLEAMNKEFGTSILVTQAVRDGAGPGFVFRPVGETTVRGASEQIMVFELVGRATMTSPDVEASEAAPPAILPQDRHGM